MNWDKIFDALINKLHMAIATLYACALLIYCWKTGKDIGPGLTNATYAFYGFLGAHAGIYQLRPDPPTAGSNGNQGSSS